MFKSVHIFVAALGCASAFLASFPARDRTLTITKAHRKPSFFEGLFQPFHSHGSGEKHMKEMYDEEQALYDDRRSHYQKRMLHDKYNPESWLDKLLNHPLHGHGSGETTLEDMYEAQQQVLYERREYFGQKEMLRRKYSDYETDHLRDIRTLDVDTPAMKNQKEDDAMWIDDSFRMPWEKENKFQP